MNRNIQTLLIIKRNRLGIENEFYSFDNLIVKSLITYLRRQHGVQNAFITFLLLPQASEIIYIAI